MQNITLRFSSRASLGALADKNCKRMLRSKKRHITNKSKSSKFRTTAEMNEAIKNLKNFKFWKIEKFQNYILTAVSKVDIVLYGEMLIFYVWVFSWFFISFITYIHYLFSESFYKNPKVGTKTASCLDNLRYFILAFVV